MVPLVSVYVALALAHNALPINPLIGEGGFPDCVNSLSPEVLATQVWRVEAVPCTRR